jgi:hypothetical protein
VASLSLKGQYPASACTARLFRWREIAVERPSSPHNQHAFAQDVVDELNSFFADQWSAQGMIVATLSWLFGWTNGLAELGCLGDLQVGIFFLFCALGILHGFLRS